MRWTFVHQRSSGYWGVLVKVKFSYAKQKLVWEVLRSGHRRKMEIPWSKIDSVEATYSNIDFDTLEIYVRRVVVIRIIVVMMLKRYHGVVG